MSGKTDVCLCVKYGYVVLETNGIPYYKSLSFCFLFVYFPPIFPLIPYFSPISLNSFFGLFKHSRRSLRPLLVVKVQFTSQQGMTSLWRRPDSRFRIVSACLLDENAAETGWEWLLTFMFTKWHLTLHFLPSLNSGIQTTCGAKLPVVI